jgi:hypothetical protein
VLGYAPIEPPTSALVARYVRAILASVESNVDDDHGESSAPPTDDT